MTHQPFAPHGAMQSHIQGQVLVVHVFGSWNIEMQRQSSLRNAPLVSELNAKGPWGNVVVVHDTLVSGLPVFEAGRKAVESLPADSQLKALAWVISPDVEGYGLLHQRYRDMYRDILPTQVFEDVASAVSWVEGVIAGAGH